MNRNIQKTQELDLQKQLAILVFNTRVKAVKKAVGSKCTFLSNYIDVSGARYIKAIISKEPHLFAIPYDIATLKEADYKRLEDLISSKCL